MMKYVLITTKKVFFEIGCCPEEEKLFRSGAIPPGPVKCYRIVQKKGVRLRLLLLDYPEQEDCSGITLTSLFKEHPFKPHFVKEKLGFEGVYINNLNIIIILSNIDCGCLLEPPQCGGSNKLPQSMFDPYIGKNPQLLI